MAPVPSVGEAFFPLDEELGLVSGGLTPRWEEVLAIGSGRVERANKLVVEACLKGAGMGLPSAERQFHARAAQCGVHRQWKHTWSTSVAQLQALRIQRLQAQSQQQLDNACWFLVVWGVRLYRLSHPSVSVAAATSPAAEALAEQPSRRPGSGYSWLKPFPPSIPTVPEEASIKNETHPGK